MTPPTIRNGSLGLFFPQWQGAGEVPALETGARRLRARLDGVGPWARVDVPSVHPLRREAGVWGHGELVEQLGAARRLLDEHQPARVLTIGGDCGVEVAPVSYLNARLGGDLAVVWFDAHADLNTPDSSPSALFHGMPLRVLLGQGAPAFVEGARPHLEPRQVFLAGVRELDPPEADFIREHALRRFTPTDLRSRPGALAQALRDSGFRHVYVHMDLDVTDPGELPDVACPTPHGLELALLVAQLRALRESLHLVGASLVEYAPGDSAASREAVLSALLDEVRTLLVPIPH
ncbi:arginase family protein [Pyxidicoccus caerfyrddinensis]|uniref:arginase family protein n=1 Tax=Pyxidicoccus caerfyrddinensis TaxID=2709663 RepID=UPI0013DC90B3|nr:arginase family protein [Pyxidicoccus caerfyrddinensis]